MTHKELRKRLYTAAVAQRKLDAAMQAITEEIEDCMIYEVRGVLKGCTVEGDGLYDNKGNRLASGGLTDGKYYCKQWAGYCEDDYHGYMYYPVDDKGTVVSVYYEC